jgi:hypothetical protein
MTLEQWFTYTLDPNQSGEQPRERQTKKDSKRQRVENHLS